jgi:4-hydroxy-tetrahydrodipicolinate reductase
MGQTLLRALQERADTVPPAASGSLPGVTLQLSGALASPKSPWLGRDAALEGPPSGIVVTADPGVGLAGAAVAVDFSLPQCVLGNARACVAAKVPLLVGATGFDAGVRAALTAAAGEIPVLIAPNTSVGVAVMSTLVRMATLALGADFEVEICEAHHRSKRDAPSGTALALGEVVAGARGQVLADVGVFARHGSVRPRSAADIGFAVLRAGDIVGEHTVIFAAGGERLEITHRATDRITFARGALRAAAWLAGRRPGLYTMADVLGVEQP